MEQHPIPQNISSYQFRLVGDMTLKQFFQLAGGFLIGIVIYSLPVHPIIKWPFIIFFSLLGAALAFLPFQERPLEQWILAFIRSVYSPTVYRWRTQSIQEYFQRETAPMAALPTSLPQVPEAASPASQVPFVSKLEETEGKFLSKLADLFSATPVPQPAFQTPTPMGQFTTPPTIQSEPQPGLRPEYSGRNEVQVPSMPKIIVEEQSVQPVQQTEPSAPHTISSVGEVLVEGQMSATQAAQFSPDAAPPSLPTIPNTISGQVMDPEGKIIEGAILEVKDASGRPVRAIRTNKVGHFLTVTSLLNGKYELATEKDGYLFEPVVVDANGSIIPPIAIRAKSRNVVSQVVS